MVNVDSKDIIGIPCNAYPGIDRTLKQNFIHYSNNIVH